MDTVAGTALDMFVHHGPPWIGKKAVEIGRYYGSETSRNTKLKKKAIDYALDKLNPTISECWKPSNEPINNQNTARKEL